MFKSLHSLKRMVGSNWSNWILGKSLVFLRPITSTALPRSYKHLTVVCCHHQKPREANIISSTAQDFRHRLHSLFFGLHFVLKEQYSEKELMKTKENAFNAESYAFLKCVLKWSARYFSKLWCRKQTLTERVLLHKERNTSAVKLIQATGV
jgi:hypothetical protein